jgi:hypothetical protein
MAAQAAPSPAQAGYSRGGSPSHEGPPNKVSSEGGRFPLNPKYVVTIMRLLRNVRLDDLVGDVPTPTVKVAPRPDMTAPKLLPQAG